MEGLWRKKGKEKATQSSSHPSIGGSSASAAAKEFNYDVFLSFTGLESESFGRTFFRRLKEETLSVSVTGETLGASSAVANCRVSIPIFSKEYVATRSCLGQVVKMNQCRRTAGQIVLPVFYNIEPHHVQNPTGPLERSFRRYQRSEVDPQVIDEWKEALREIGSLKGYMINEPIDEKKNVDRVINGLVSLTLEQVFNRLVNEVPLNNNLVGIEQSYRSVAEMLQLSSERDVRIVGICGMPGIGKTTLVQAVYNNLHRLFKGCGFVSSIQERSGKHGLNFLQHQLIFELQSTTRARFGLFMPYFDFIKDTLGDTRVLIVLDDVECLEHIEAFGVVLNCLGPDSRIILTTRKPELLVEAKVPYRYFLEELDELHALNLFYRHAFKNDSPEEEYRHLSTQIASSARGIPLVIESVGSYLFNYRNKEKERWEEVLQQLRSCLYKPLQELLMLSHGYISNGRWHFYHNKECFHVGESNDITHYDVVLSFDARDKVKNLVESLHKSMASFRIGIFALNGDSMQVHVTGKVLIPVISNSYASNSSCLEMLAHMVKCRRISRTNHILPIFCAIEPSDVRLQTPLYGSCLSEDNKVENRWKESLIEVANISGWTLPKTSTAKEFHNLIKSVCQTTSDKLKLNWCMENHFIGIDRHIKCIWNFLNPEVNDVRSIAIRGEDGTGKTTLAKALYHQLSSNFEGCSFLREIDERTQYPDGIKSLQAKLISDLLNRDCDVLTSKTEGINLIKERFQHMKVLIILDDVAKSFHVEDLVGQLSWFGLGSRIIITAGLTTDIPLTHSNYMIMKVDYWCRNFDTSCALLSMHTFRKSDPLSNYKYLSWSIAYGLLSSQNPYLTLEIMGSLLYGKDEEEWRRLDDMGKGDLKTILRMSYERLNEMQKKIFLDISCLPIGMDRQIASYLWYDSLHCPGFIDTDLEALIFSSLVKVDANNEIWMHRLVRDFGREIVDQKNEQTKGGGETKRLKLEFPAAAGSERMADMRFFKLDGTNIIRSANPDFMSQRGIIWQWWPLNLLANLRSERLKVLDMSRSKVTEDWEGWHQIKVPQLRVLNLTGCSDLMLTPDFSFCLGLEMLILECCSQLVNIDPSIGKLKLLTTLNLRCCLELCSLPKEVGHLTALRELLLDGTPIRDIPVSIGHLKNLHVLTAIDCLSLRNLPGYTCDLRFVTVIKLDQTNITELPFLIGKMNLQHLSLRGCQLIKRLACLVGEVESSLVELDVSKTSISELPESITKLKVLKVLKMDFCSIIGFPENFGELKKLEEIHASWCTSLENLPNDVGELKCLRILKVAHSRISSLPQSIKRLSCLETLDCTSCSNLQNLPELPSSLTHLKVESEELKELPDFANLRRLKVFTLVNGDIPDVSMAVTARKDDPFHWLIISTFMGTLELCLSNIKTLPGIPCFLRKLSLRCASLQYIPPLPFTLVSFSIQDCASLKKMPCLRYTDVLEEIKILRCPGIVKIEGLENLKALKVLRISGSGIVSLDGLDKLISLMRLTLSDCKEIEKLEGLGKLQALLALAISSSGIVSLSGLDKLASLESLTLSDCPKLKEIEGFAELQALEVLTISSCGIESLTGLDKLASLKKLTLLDCGFLGEIPDLDTLKGVDLFIAENSDEDIVGNK